jgi:hypothetical protein
MLYRDKGSGLGDSERRETAYSGTAVTMEGDLMLTGNVVGSQGSGDMSCQPGEEFVTVDNVTLFPALVGDGMVARFRPAIVHRIQGWVEGNAYVDDAVGPLPALSMVDELVVVEFVGGDEPAGRTVFFEADADGRYAIDLWTWQRPWMEPVTAQHQVQTNLLSYATAFTFDGNDVPVGDRTWDSQLVVTVEQAGPDEWRLRCGGLVLNHETGQWLPERAARKAEGGARWDYHRGRDSAVWAAVQVLEDLRQGKAPTS